MHPALSVGSSMHQPTSEMPDLRRLATHERVAAMTSWLRARGLVVEDAASAQRAWHAERKKINKALLCAAVHCSTGALALRSWSPSVVIRHETYMRLVVSAVAPDQFRIRCSAPGVSCPMLQLYLTTCTGMLRRSSAPAIRVRRNGHSSAAPPRPDAVACRRRSHVA